MRWSYGPHWSFLDIDAMLCDQQDKPERFQVVAALDGARVRQEVGRRRSGQHRGSWVEVSDGGKTRFVLHLWSYAHAMLATQSVQVKKRRNFNMHNSTEARITFLFEGVFIVQIRRGVNSWCACSRIRSYVLFTCGEVTQYRSMDGSDMIGDGVGLV